MITYAVFFQQQQQWERFGKKWGRFGKRWGRFGSGVLPHTPSATCNYNVHDMCEIYFSHI